MLVFMHKNNLSAKSADLEVVALRHRLQYLQNSLKMVRNKVLMECFCSIPVCLRCGHSETHSKAVLNGWVWWCKRWVCNIQNLILLQWCLHHANINGSMEQSIGLVVLDLLHFGWMRPKREKAMTSQLKGRAALPAAGAVSSCVSDSVMIGSEDLLLDGGSLLWWLWSGRAAAVACWSINSVTLWSCCSRRGWMWRVLPQPRRVSWQRRFSSDTITTAPSPSVQQHSIFPPQPLQVLLLQIRCTNAAMLTQSIAVRQRWLAEHELKLALVTNVRVFVRKGPLLICAPDTVLLMQIYSTQRFGGFKW